MPLPSQEAILEFCRRSLDDPGRGAADLLRIGLAGNAERLLPLLIHALPEVPDPDLALVHLERFCRKDALPAAPETLHVLLALFGYSPYLAESFINDRTYLADLLRARRQGAWDLEEWRQELARRLRISHADDPWDALRSFKRRANLRIGLRDLQRAAPLPEICREISSAADALIGCALRIVLADLAGRFGPPQAYDEAGRTVESSMAVVALGKLGGMELNYSSDIDLLFVYSRDGETTGLSGHPEKQITNKEFFTRAAEELARGLGQISTEGQVFRVDCRLRPGGRDGDLVNQVQAAIVYYGTWARPWERQALIKARFCAGDPHLGAQFLAGCERVVYRRPADTAAVDNIRAMKDRIDAELARRGLGTRDLKLGTGGIREIEFTVQGLQLVHGGAEPWVREANTLLAMHRLADKGFLSVSEYGSLSSAYVLLREAEHRLQLHRNLQRSALPSAERDRRALARAMGYRDSTSRQEASSFLADLDRHREAVRSIYDAVLGRLSQGRLEETPGPDPLLDAMSDGAVSACLAASGIRSPQTLLGSMKSIARFLAGPGIPVHTRREFRRLTPILMKELACVQNPVRALKNFERYLASLGLDRAQLDALVARGELLAPLVRLFAGSHLLSSTLIHRPGLVLEADFDLAVARDRSVEEHLERLRLAETTCADVESFVSFLRVYQRTQLLYVGLKDLNRQAGASAISRALSDLAEAIVRAVVAFCARTAGWPAGDGGDGWRTPGFIVLGLGKVGYQEMDYSSDLDLVFLYDEGVAPQEGLAERHAAANRLAVLVMEALTSITREGALYAVDTRLRPFGGEGELAQPIGRVRDYFSSSAEIWEMQSFLKARPMAGDLELGLAKASELEAFLLGRTEPAELSRAVGEMKHRLEIAAGERGGTAAGAGAAIDIKLGSGGLSAIQFAIQYLQLRHRVASPPHKRTTRLLATLRAAGCLDEEAYGVFFKGFRFLRELEHQVRLIHGRALSRLPASHDALEEIAQALHYSADAEVTAREKLMGDLAHHRTRIEATYRRVIEQAALPAAVEG